MRDFLISLTLASGIVFAAPAAGAVTSAVLGVEFDDAVFLEDSGATALNFTGTSFNVQGGGGFAAAGLGSVTSTASGAAIQLTDQQGGTPSFFVSDSGTALLGSGTFGTAGFATDGTSGTVEYTFTDVTGSLVAFFPDGVLVTVNGAFASDPRGSQLSVLGEDASIRFNPLQPAPIPLPAGVWLMLSGLAGFGLLARRRRQAAA